MRPEVGKPGASSAFSFFYIEPRFMRYNVGSLFKGLFNGLVVILGMVFCSFLALLLCGVSLLLLIGCGTTPKRVGEDMGNTGEPTEAQQAEIQRLTEKLLAKATTLKIKVLPQQQCRPK
jgi:hypothetical protein